MNRLKIYIPSFFILSVSFIFFYISYTSAEQKILLIDTNASCITPSCHADMGKKKYVHTAGVDAKYCNRCHEIVKEGEHLFKNLPIEARSLCARCHSENINAPADLKGSPPKIIFEDKNMQFHPLFAEGKCTGCHDAHESNFYKHLKAEYPGEFYAPYSAETYTLCINANCHQGFEKALTEPRTLSATLFRNGNLNLHFSHVNIPKGRTCRTCHQICYPRRVSKNQKLIRETFQFGKRQLTLTYEKTETGGSCGTTCHRVSKYDRYAPVFNLIKTTPPPGRDATVEELKLSKERDMKEQKKKEGAKNEEKK